MNSVIGTALEAVGATLVVVGLFMLAPWAGVVALGVAFIAAGISAAR